MKRLNPAYLWISIVITITIYGCSQQVSNQTAPESSGSSEVGNVYQPALVLGELFHEIQLAGIFPDSKTFADCKPLFDPEIILDRYLYLKKVDSLDLDEFLKKHFAVPETNSSSISNTNTELISHLHSLWPQLTRQPDDQRIISSLLPLPFPYVVPGGRFREIYYWDSYFTMLGLLESKQDSLVINMIRNFGHLIDTHGFIPNGNRSYYLGRSQPPFFSSMVMLWADHHGMSAALPFLPQMIKEHEFWMEGKEKLSSEIPSIKRVVQIKENVVLNRYWDDFDEPRPEAYKEDYELAQAFPKTQRQEIYRNLRAGAESGWDYSSRWFSDGASLDSIITTQIIPVDLNCLIYFLELSIANLKDLSGDMVNAGAYRDKAILRKQAIQSYFWDSEAGYFSDFNIKTKTTTSQFSAAGMVPLYFEMATKNQAEHAVQFLKNNLLYPGGVVSTMRNTGQQWDFPNGWAPQQWMAIQGLKNYQFHELATDISSRWVSVASQVFANTGKMMEKYNVVDLTLPAGGGEYPTQDGFGWTNGVTLVLMGVE